jgi:bifunctional non-homologous end joining protein LigD
VPTEHRSGAILWKQATDLAPFPPYPWSVLLHGDRGDGPYFFIAIKRYIHGMVSRTYGRGRPLNAPAAFIHPCQPIVAKQPPSGPGWAHELKLDGYRLQIHVRDGRVHLYTINGADWSKRYPLFVRDAAKIKGSAIVDAEVVWLDPYGMSNFEALHSRASDAKASACAFDLLMRDGDDLRRKPYSERKTILLKALRRSRAGA